MIYLDNAATTRPNENAIKRASEFLSTAYFNPSAMYKEGFSVQTELKKAKLAILSHVADSAFFDVIFTSCGTESNNTALFSFGKRGNVVTTEGEHSSVIEPLRELKNRGMIELRVAPLQADGKVDEKQLLSLIDEKTTLVSVMHVNNETGAINDINALAKTVKKRFPKVVFHSDGVQGYGKIPFRLSKEVDLYSISAHKIGGIKGTGALIKRKTLNLRPFLWGGGQENGLRSGTENSFGIKQFEYATEEKFSTIQEDFERLKGYKKILEEGLNSEVYSCFHFAETSPYIASVSAKGMRGEILQRMACDKGLLVGTGSACSSNSQLLYSHVLLACGVDKELAIGALRLSFSPQTTEEEVVCAVQILNEIALSYGKVGIQRT